MERIIVLKCGGSTMEELPDHFFSNISVLKNNGYQPIIVHGGGPAIQEMLDQLQIKSEFVDGLRKTNKKAMDAVEMVLTGKINNMISYKLNQAGIQAMGLCGTDANLLLAKAKDFERYGYVGEITKVNSAILKSIVASGVVPVIAPVAIGDDGERFNINADTAAGEIAKAMQALQLIFVTDVPGIMNKNQLLPCVTDEEIEQMLADGTIHGGMIPKVKAAVQCLNEDLEEVMIVDAKQAYPLHQEQFKGTIIKKSVGVV
ncbi:MAG TPA: acetylglutamate kinase [Bacillota bacterium]|nr:acetylglutamate kinase [Bacillota bacterium]